MLNKLGYSFIELLISLIILSIMLLGFDATLLVSLEKRKTIFDYAIALQQLKSMAELLQISHGKVGAYLPIWIKQVAAVLPNGKGEVVEELLNWRIVIKWGEFTQDCTYNKISHNGCVFIRILPSEIE